MNGFNLPMLPPQEDVSTIPVLRAAAEAHRHLGELKGLVAAMPNAGILINTLSLQEAKDSSEVESIITTHDDLFKASIFSEYAQSPAAKEVADYAHALREGHAAVTRTGLLTLRDLLTVQEALVKNNAGLRKLPGTDLKNTLTGKIVYVPPQHSEQIKDLMDNLIRIINDDTQWDADPLVKMAVLHYQFESIHPFYDGNGRCGRILNILYLVLKKLLDIPVLYLSRYVIRNKQNYYAYLQAVRDQSDWEGWLLFMLRGVGETAAQTIILLRQISALMRDYKRRIREQHPKLYSQEMLNNLFKHPYTKIEFVEQDLGIVRQTATKYLGALVKGGFLEIHKIGRSNYYVNRPLFNLLSGTLPPE